MIRSQPNAAARLRLERRLDALLAVLQASRDAERLAQLRARAGISRRVPHRVLMAELYWYLVENPV